MIDVIIPVYQGLAQTRRCLDSVLGSRVSAPHEVVVIDDASPEPAISAWLATLAAAGRITLITHAANQGFVASANEGMALHGDRDVALLNSDTEVSDGWLDRLAACAAREANIATVTPFSNNATICSYPGLEPPYALPDAMDVATLDRLFHEENAGSSFAVPTGVGFCLYIRRACLNAVGAFDAAAFGKGYGEEVDFCLRASRAGWQHRLAADVFVFHEGEASFGAGGAGRREQAQRTVDARYPEFIGQVRDFVLRDPAAPARERVAARVAILQASHGLRAALPDGVEPPVICVVSEMGGSDARAQETLTSATRQSILGEVPGCVIPAGNLNNGLRSILAANPGRDVLLLAAGVVTPPGWDARLVKALHADPAVGAVAPMVTGDPLFSPLPDGVAPAVDIDALDAAAFNAGDRRYYEAPTIPGACAGVRASSLHDSLNEGATGSTCAEFNAALARHIRRSGRSCTVLDHLCVTGVRGAEAQVPDAVEATAFRRHHPLGQLRRTLSDTVARELPRAVRPGLDQRPVRLHVMHYWGGGVERWVRDFARADAGAVHLTLASYRIGKDGGQRFELRTSPTDAVPARTWDLAQPIRSTSTGSVEYRRLLREAVADFCVESIVVSSLIGHGLDALETGLPTAVVMHDLYPVCQAINPWFKGRVCDRCNAEDLTACGQENTLNVVFRDADAGDWLALRRGFVNRLVAARPVIVVPSHWVKRTLVALEPRLGALDIRVHGHGIDERPARLPYPALEPGARLRLAVVGRMSPAKGATLLRQAADALRPYADLWVVGEGKAGKELAEACGWSHIPAYTPQSLGDVLARIAPHAAVLPSVVPETFSFTLSELLNLAVVPLATKLGSFAERIEHGGNGFLFEPDPHHLAALVRVLHDEPVRLPSVAARLATQPPQPSAGEMVRVYRELLPSHPRQPARFAIGMGCQTGLSEPYRHLSRAYADLQAAYEQTREALHQTQDALLAASHEPRSAHEASPQAPTSREEQT